MKVRNYFSNPLQHEFYSQGADLRYRRDCNSQTNKKYCSKLPEKLNAEVFRVRQELTILILNSSLFKQ